MAVVAVVAVVAEVVVVAAGAVVGVDEVPERLAVAEVAAEAVVDPLASGSDPRCDPACTQLAVAKASEHAASVVVRRGNGRNRTAPLGCHRTTALHMAVSRLRGRRASPRA